MAFAMEMGSGGNPGEPQLMAKSEWKGPFRTWPAWTCPTCQKSTLKVIKNSLQKKETGQSIESHPHEAWDPTWIVSRFVVLFECTNDQCGEVVTCSGEATVDEVEFRDSNGEPSGEWVDHFDPKYFYPPLRLFRIPAECPEDVTGHIDRAFASAWSDRASSVNAMRTALEAILSERGVPRTTINKHKKRVPISLHDRIVKYGQKDSEAADYLVALKWLGNFGSHAHGAAPELADLLDGLSVFEHAIGHIYVKRAKTVKRLAAGLVRRKGRPKATPRGTRSIRT